MPITKTATELLAPQALAANVSVNSAELNLTAKAGARVFTKITNGGSAPSSAPVVQFFGGGATGVRRLLYTASGDTVPNSVTHLNCRYSLPDMFANVTITAGGTNGCTVEVVALDVSL